VETFPQQVVDVIGYLYDALQPDHPFASLKAAPGPAPETAPDVWLLGSSDYSAKLAAHLGLPFAFADFFGTTGGHGPAVAEVYRRNFSPSGLYGEPKLNVTLQVLCAPTNAEAQRIAASRNFNRARRMLVAQGHEEPREGLLPPEEAAARPLNEQAQAYVQEHVDGYIDGDPAQVAEGIATAAARYGTTDVGIVTIAHALADRIRSYELIAREFGLLSI
jgi:luciferase family oxidoreductase group 1